MPSCTRAPPESLMKTKGEPVFSDCSMISATLMECTSPAEPPDTVKSWLARWTRRPPTEAAPVTTPSAGKSLAGHAEQRGAMLGEQSGLFEAVRIDQRIDSLARRQLAALALLFQLVLAAAQHGFAGALAELGDSSPALYEWPYDKFLLSSRLLAPARRLPCASCRCSFTS